MGLACKYYFCVCYGDASARMPSHIPAGYSVASPMRRRGVFAIDHWNRFQSLFMFIDPVPVILGIHHPKRKEI